MAVVAAFDLEELVTLGGGTRLSCGNSANAGKARAKVSRKKGAYPIASAAGPAAFAATLRVSASSAEKSANWVAAKRFSQTDIR